MICSNKNKILKNLSPKSFFSPSTFFLFFFHFFHVLIIIFQGAEYVKNLQIQMAELEGEIERLKEKENKYEVHGENISKTSTAAEEELKVRRKKIVVFCSYFLDFEFLLIEIYFI